MYGRIFIMSAAEALKGGEPNADQATLTVAAAADVAERAASAVA